MTHKWYWRCQWRAVLADCCPDLSPGWSGQAARQECDGRPWGQLCHCLRCYGCKSDSSSFSSSGMGIVRGNTDFSRNKKKSAEKFLPVHGKNVSGGKNKVTTFLAQRLPGHMVSRLQRWQGYTAWWTVEKNLTTMAAQTVGDGSGYLKKWR